MRWALQLPWLLAWRQSLGASGGTENPGRTHKYCWMEERMERGGMRLAGIHRAEHWRGGTYAEEEPQKSTSGSAWIVDGILCFTCIGWNSSRSGKINFWQKGNCQGEFQSWHRLGIFQCPNSQSKEMLMTTQGIQLRSQKVHSL